MKTTNLPPLRVSPELRKQAEAVLEQGETLSGFVLDAVTRSIEHRNARQEFTPENGYPAPNPAQALS